MFNVEKIQVEIFVISNNYFNDGVAFKNYDFIFFKTVSFGSQKRRLTTT